MPKAKDDAPEMEEKVNQPTGAPIAPGEGNVLPSNETLSHQWQANSPAINTNALAGYVTENVVQKLNTAQEAEDAPKAYKPEVEKEVSKDEYKARTKLDVSDPRYINPSLDHFEVK